MSVIDCRFLGVENIVIMGWMATDCNCGLQTPSALTTVASDPRLPHRPLNFLVRENSPPTDRFGPSSKVDQR
jgi:hypothetical protein